MFNSTVLDIAVGLIFTFLALSLVVSAITEAIASALKWRATTLLEGVKQLLNDPQLSGLALGIYNHALVNPLADGKATSAAPAGATAPAAAPSHIPAYIGARHFADAFLDIAKITPGTAQEMVQQITANITDPQLKMLLSGMAERAGGNIEQLRSAIGSWFDNAMDRLSGVYKRKAQAISMVIAICAAGIFNVSAIEIGRALWYQPMVAKTIEPVHDLTPVGALKELSQLSLPIGWTVEKFTHLTVWSGAELLLGWLVTAVATLFGAPFWFDALQQIVRLKGSGPSPGEHQSGAAAAS